MLASGIRFRFGHDRRATRRVLDRASGLDFIVCVEGRSNTAPRVDPWLR